MNEMVKRASALLFSTLLGSLLGAAGPVAAQDSAEGLSVVQALQIVDCLLPGQIRSIGGRPYPTPRRPTRTTAADCAARGGEYLLYDRADYRSALAVWLPSAQDGDARAQLMVGEIYERGAGGEPDYAAAAEWYRRAADQGDHRAQFNLGTLYERGLGVAPDPIEALNWYRLASGLDDDSLIFRSAANAREAELRATLGRQIEQRDRQIDVLSRDIESLNAQLRESARDADEVRAEIAVVRELLEQIDTARRTDAEALEALGPAPAAAESTADAPSAVAFEQPERVHYRRSDFGRYYALIIGVQDYDLLDDLTSPANDVARIGQLLEERYGFSVLSLVNPDQTTLMRAVNRLNETLEEDDNLLIYFAGHGTRLRSGAWETGYWLPKNAEPPPDDTLWVANEFVSRHLGRIEARRVLIISDSCYSGLLGDDPGYVMVGEGSYTDDYIEWKRPKRSRLVLSSGADSPVVDDDDHGHSVFARALLEELKTNSQVLTAPELFLRIRRRVQESAALGTARTPELKAIRDAGHEVGDFFFVPAAADG